MIHFFDESRKAARQGLCAIFLLGAFGCSSTLVERVIDARGGPLGSYRKHVDAEVVAGMPGTWEWEVDYRAPDSFRWTLGTHGEEQSLLFDGRDSRQQLGSVTLPPVPADDAVRSLADWFAFTSLDFLQDPRVSWSEIDAADLPEGAASGLVARCAPSGGRFELFFDERYLLVRARGHVALVPIGAGQLDADFSDYREVGGYRLPFAGEYRLEGHDLMREAVRSWTPDASSLEEASVFRGQ